MRRRASACEPPWSRQQQQFQQKYQGANKLSDSSDWAGKVALVTGGGSGIGAAAARMIAAKGATVALLDVVEASAAGVMHDIEAAGGKAFTLAADVGDEAQMKAAFEAIAVKEGRIDMMVVSAGINGTWAPV